MAVGPHGLLDLAKGVWEEQPTPLSQRSRTCGGDEGEDNGDLPVVREHMAQPREFQPGEKVLVLIPTAESKFLAMWHVPHDIVERVGDDNYKVLQTGQRKPLQLYHVNLLKKWHAREALCVTWTRPQEGPPSVEVAMGEDLSPTQRQELRELVQRNMDVFSEVPVCTDLVEHHIHTSPREKVREC
jgi:hypothetical protein